MVLLGESSYFLHSPYYLLVYLIATNTGHPPSFFFFCLVQSFSLNKFIILEERHCTKKADPNTMCWWISIFISSSDISNAHLTFLFLYLINVSTIHVQKRTFNLHAPHVPPPVLLNSINCTTFHLDTQKPRSHSRVFPLPYPQQPIYQHTLMLGCQNKIPHSLLTIFCSMA